MEEKDEDVYAMKKRTVLCFPKRRMLTTGIRPKKSRNLHLLLYLCTMLIYKPLDQLAKQGFARAPPPSHHPLQQHLIQPYITLSAGKASVKA